MTSWGSFGKPLQSRGWRSPAGLSGRVPGCICWNGAFLGLQAHLCHQAALEEAVSQKIARVPPSPKRPNCTAATVMFPGCRTGKTPASRPCRGDTKNNQGTAAGLGCLLGRGAAYRQGALPSTLLANRYRLRIFFFSGKCLLSTYYVLGTAPDAEGVARIKTDRKIPNLPELMWREREHTQPTGE